MRKITETDRLRQLRHQKDAARRKALQRDRAKERRRFGLHYTQVQRGDPTRHGGRRLIVAPASLSLRPAAYEGTMNFLAEVREAVLVNGERVGIDLRDCTLLSPEVAPLLAAEIGRLQFLKGKAAISGMSPRDKAARAALHAMGFFEALGLRDPQERSGTVVYSIESGTSLDGQITKRMADDIGHALGLDELGREPIQKALNEALENITDHAYLDQELLLHPAESGRWWISAITFAEKKSAYVLACDLGVTISATVPSTAKKRGERNVAALAQFLQGRASSKDESLLAAAFEEGVTRREDGKGGRGLGKMAQLMQQFVRGELSVWSGNACAMLSKDTPGVKTKRLPACFPGTYVMWHLVQDASA